MLINLKRILLTINGDNFKNPQKDEKTPPTDFTLLDACVKSLVDDAPGNRTPGEEKYTRYKLAERMNACDKDQFEIEASEIVLLKRLIGEVWPPQVAGQAWDLLEGKLV